MVFQLENEKNRYFAHFSGKCSFIPFSLPILQRHCTALFLVFWELHLHCNAVKCSAVQCVRNAAGL